MKKRVSNSSLVLVSLLLAALVLGGCPKKKEASSPQPPAAQKQKPSVTPPSSPVQKQSSSAKSAQTGGLFDFAKKKDPFKPFSPEPEMKKPSPTVSGKVEDLLPIQMYDVSKFRVSGIILEPKEKTALVIDPAGKGYVVKEGMLMGNNNGRITQITRTAIVVTEQYREDSGRIRKRSVTISLPLKK